MFLAAYSIIFGIETANGLKWILGKTGKSSSLRNFRVNSLKSHIIVLSVLILVWGGLWTTSGILEKQEFKNGGSEAQLWLGCLVGPLGVWLRWWLARLNGCGLGQAGRWKWIPFGTLAANVSAACVMAGLATLKKAVRIDSRIFVLVAVTQNLFIFIYLLSLLHAIPYVLIVLCPYNLGSIGVYSHKAPPPLVINIK